jgi:hypothetical protein
MTWVLIVWSVLILVWAIGAGSSAGSHCASEATKAGREGCEAGTGLGVLFVLLIGFFGFAFFSLIWFMTRRKGRVCPACGENVKKGRTDCAGCGHDFAAALQPQSG